MNIQNKIKNYSEYGFTADKIVDDPGTGKKLADQALASEKDVDRAVEAATRVHKRCFLTDMRPVERARMVKKIGDYLLEKADEIAPILSREAGKTLFEARLEVTNAARYFEYYGNQAETLEGRSITHGWVKHSLLMLIMK